jgi:flagellar basal-body rod protein FlgG
MMNALTTAATGLQAQQAKMADISNDLANVSTDGYKRSRTEFQDLMYDTVKEAGGQIGAGSMSPVGIQTGMGVKVVATHKMFEQGPARPTYHPFDIMIEGRGFLPVQMSNGEIAYTRNGAFHLDAQGKLLLTNGARMLPEVTIPQNALEVKISNSGEIKATLPGNAEAVLGQIQLINFQNEEGLHAQGDSMYKATVGSGAPLQGIPGESGVGWIQQGFLEGSNVNIANSMVDMISTQRAYEMGTKVMGVADQMMGATANIK